MTDTAPGGAPADDAPSTERIEHDSMGKVAVPADALWGAQTQRAVQNFQISGERLPREMVGALALIKAAAAIVNGELGVLPPDVAAAIHDAAVEVAAGRHDDQFPVDVFQTGSGTSSNMNANEVIARLAAAGSGGLSTPTTTSTLRSRPTTCSRPRSTWPRRG